MSMVLDDVCNASVYDKNAFYILGLPVVTTSRKIRRRQEDLIDGLSEMGEKAWCGEFEKYLLGSLDAPNAADAKNLFDRLKDPEFYATEMFFWFWPRGEEADPAIEAILKGERDVAVRSWVMDMGRPGTRGVVARHNLAVVLHYYAIDGERRLLESSSCGLGKTNPATDYSDVLGSSLDGIGAGQSLNAAFVASSEYVTMVDRYWKSSFELWEGLADDEAFWDVFSGMVEKLNDPRLDDEFICSFRERFPVCFDGINADFMVSYAKRKNIAAAKRHFDYMVSTMSGDDDVEETMERAFKPFADQVKVLIKQCEGTTKANQVLQVCRALLKESDDFVKILKAIVPAGNTYTKSIINDIVTAIDNKLPLYSRETGDYEPCLSLTRQLLELAATPMMKEKIRKSIDEWMDLVKQERERCTCVVCGSYVGRNIPKKSVKFHCDVRRDPLMYGRYEFRTRTIEVPVCSSCSWKFQDYHSKSYGPVKQSLSEGWKFGEKPEQSELDKLF